jgi:hypothetical protein
LSYNGSREMRAPGTTHLRGNVLLDFGTLLCFALEYRCGVPWKIFDAMQVIPHCQREMIREVWTLSLRLETIFGCITIGRWRLGQDEGGKQTWM